MLEGIVACLFPRLVEFVDAHLNDRPRHESALEDTKREFLTWRDLLHIPSLLDFIQFRIAGRYRLRPL